MHVQVHVLSLWNNIDRQPKKASVFANVKVEHELVMITHGLILSVFIY